MAELQKVLVVDDGARSTDYCLSAELAGLGYASVTASFEATEEILDLLPSPAAIVLQMPSQNDGEAYEEFLALADRLKASSRTSGIPVILIDPKTRHAGGATAMLQSRFGSRSLHQPDL
jgi:CheY-like chemotaxis protein